MRLLYRIRLVSTAVCFSILAYTVHAEQDSGPFEISPIGTWKPEHYLVAAFCLLGFVVIFLEFVLFLRARDRVSASDIMRTFSTTLILIAVVALLGIGYNAAQVQPAIALFGTLLGYLMGRGEASGPTRANQEQPRDGAHHPPEI